MIGKPAQLVARFLFLSFAWLSAVILASAQTAPVEKPFAASKTEVENALRSMQPTSGRLPILDGFVLSGDSALDRYQRGFYQYAIQVVPQAGGQSKVRVTAKITAWYAGDTPAQSGYRVVPSNGRLEADLLDRLQEALSTKSASDVRHGPAFPGENSAPVTSGNRNESLPENPGTRTASGFSGARSASPALPSREQALTSKLPPRPEDQRVQELARQAKNLEDILHNQAHPQNLTSIREAHTPIYERPFDHAKVLFYADAEDEFQIVDTAGTWVHVQISGISRGWIKSNQVALPGSAVVPDTASTANKPAESQTAPFHPTREENSMFPGNWSALRGKTVKIIWVQPSPNATTEASKIDFAKSVFRKTYPQISESNSNLAGVVIVFDSEDGGMAAATTAALQQWNAGHLSDTAFWKQCWLDPSDSFRQKP